MSRSRQFLLVGVLVLGALAFALASTGGVVWLDLYARPAVKAWLKGF